MEQHNFNNPAPHFKLHIHEGHITAPEPASETQPKASHNPEEPQNTEADQPHQPHQPQYPTGEHSRNTPQSSGFKSFMQDTGRHIIASAVILVASFLLINSGAYYEIAKSKVTNLLGLNDTQILDQIAEGLDQDKATTVLQTSNNPEIQKKQIPDLDLEVSPTDTRLIIPRINKNIPVVRASSESLIARDWKALEKDMQEALKNGVVHYPGTSFPGQGGNIVITGHSSYFPWDPGRFKDVFALLQDVVIGDKIVVYYDQNKYVYEVSNIQVVLPEDIEVLQSGSEEQLTLITCTPVGTNLKRLVVTAKPVQS